MRWHRIIQRLMTKNQIDCNDMKLTTSVEKFEEVFDHLSLALDKYESKISSLENTLEVAQDELKNKWEELAKFQLQWKVITDYIPIYSLILDQNLVLIDKNKNPFPDLFQTLLGLDLRSVVDTESNSELIKDIELSFERQKIFRGSVNIHGKYFEYALIPMPEYQNYQSCLNLILHDVTSVKESQMALEEVRAKSLYTAKMSTVGEMAGSIAHEINTPLAVIFLILGRLQSIQSIESFNLIQFQQWTESLLKNSQKISSIVNGLRKFAKGSFSQSMVNEDIFSVVVQAINLCQEKLRNNNIDVRNEVESGIHFIRCQDAMIQQAIFTMIQNSFEAVEGSRNAWIRFRVSSDGAFLKLLTRPKVSGQMFEFMI